MAGWGTGGWGTSPWGGGTSASLSFFLPPTAKRYPPLNSSIRKKGTLWRFYWHHAWATEALAIGSNSYVGGRWNGPLTAAQKAELEMAGHGARIVTVQHTWQLPPGLD
jgi:hypothetical protein